MLRFQPSPDEVRLAQDSLKEKGYYIIRNIIDGQAYERARSEANDYFLKQKNNNRLPKALRGGVAAGQRDIEGYSDTKAWKIYRSCYFPWNRPNPEVHQCIKLSRLASSLRNNIAGLKSDHGAYLEADNTINYTSLSLYPSGGGFLNRHRDIHPDSIDYEPLIHFKIDLSIKGKDYDIGGFAIWEKNGTEINISALIQPGDILLFDGSCYHEIKSIHGEGIGRIALFEIPTVTTEESRSSYYAGDGEEQSLIQRASSKIKNARRRLLL